MERMISGAVTLICVAGALLAVVGSLGVGPSGLGLWWLKSHPALWHVLRVVNFYGLWVAAAYVLIRGAVAIHSRNRLVVSLSSATERVLIVTSVVVLALSWPVLAMLHLQDDAVITHVSRREDVVVCRAAWSHLAGRLEDAHNVLADFNSYYYTDFEWRYTRTARLTTGAIEAAKLANRLAPLERMKVVQSSTLDEEVKDWVVRCLPRD